MINRVILSVTLLFSISSFATADEVSLAWETSPRTIDPRYANDANSQYLADLVHCSLISFDRDGNLKMQAARTSTWLNSKTLAIQLQENIRFSDGSLVTPEDIVATYNFFKRPPTSATPSALANAFKKMKSVRASGPGQVIFELEEPDASFIDNLMIGILPKRLAERKMIEKDEGMVGCGPFTLSKIEINNYVLTRNNHFSLGPKAKITRIAIKIVHDDTTRFAKLVKGELDLVQNGIGRDKLKTIQTQYPQLKIVERPGLNVTYIGFNFRDKTLAHKDVRQAIAMALNRPEIIKYLLQDTAEPAASFLTQGNPYRNNTLPTVPFDIAKAKTLLDGAGFPQPDTNQPRLSLSLKTTADNTRVSIAQGIAGQLRKVGIKVEVQALEWGKFKSDVEKGQVQMWLMNWVGFKDPDIFRYAFATESFPPNGGNRGWYSNPQLDALLGSARTFTDIAKRKPLYDQAQTIIASDLPYVFLWHDKNFAVLNKALKNFELYADGRLSSLAEVTK